MFQELHDTKTEHNLNSAYIIDEATDTKRQYSTYGNRGNQNYKITFIVPSLSSVDTL